MKKLNLLFLIAMLTFTCASLPAATTEQSEINRISATWENSYKQGDMGTLGNLYSTNAVMLPPSSEILSDNSAITGYWESLKKVGVTQFQLSEVALNFEGNRAYQTALWQATRVTGSGPDITLEGNISNVYEKQSDGSWKISLQSWN